MESDNQWKELANQVQTFTVFAVSSLLDTTFLALWVFLQWLIDVKVIAAYQLSGIDTWVLLAFQILFAISTLMPVAIFIYTDIRIMLLRAGKRIRHEMKRRK